MPYPMYRLRSRSSTLHASVVVSVRVAAIAISSEGSTSRCHVGVTLLSSRFGCGDADLELHSLQPPITCATVAHWARVFGDNAPSERWVSMRCDATAFEPPLFWNWAAAASTPIADGWTGRSRQCQRWLAAEWSGLV